MKASTAQARLLAALEQHASRDEEVYVSTNDCPPSLVMVVAHAAGHGPLFGVDMFLEGEERELVAIALRAERLGFAVVPVSAEAKRAARALARGPWARRGWGGGASTRSLLATAMGEVEVDPGSADRVPA